MGRENHQMWLTWDLNPSLPPVLSLPPPRMDREGRSNGEGKGPDSEGCLSRWPARSSWVGQSVSGPDSFRASALCTLGLPHRATGAQLQGPGLASANPVWSFHDISISCVPMLPQRKAQAQLDQQSLI